jgi:lipopolysaccharide export LptBFGC system permease protein LptF
MRTVRRMLYRDIVASVVFVALAFLALSFFIDFVDELQSIGRPGHGLLTAIASSLLELPGNLYELLPIAVLIGTIYTLARLAQTSEFTILRTGGLSPARALLLLALLALVFSALTFALGDYVVPFTEATAAEGHAQRRAQARRHRGVAEGAARHEHGERHFAVNVHRRSRYVGGRAHLRVRRRRASLVAHQRTAGSRRQRRRVAAQRRRAHHLAALVGQPCAARGARVVRHAGVAQHAARQRRGGRGAAAEDHVHRRVVALQPSPE